MSTKAILSRLPIVAVGCVAFVMTAGAGVWNKKTIVRFPEAVEVPGNVTLPAGTYVMKLADSSSNRHIVQFFNEDENKVYATVLAIPNQRMQPADKTVLTFYETPKGYPMFLREWFYPGDTFGQEFVYSKERREYIARLMNLNDRPAEPVAVAQTGPTPAPEEPESSPAPVNQAPAASSAADSIDDDASSTAAAAAEPSAADADQDEPQAAPPAPSPQPQAAETLPQTATSAPAIGLMALTLMGSALMMKAARRM